MSIICMASRVRTLAVSAFLVVIAGCAAVQVDVDVYKGPLINQKDVQTEVLVNMANSAQPLLIYLRDTIEWPRLTTAEIRSGMTLKGGIDWYSYGYMQDDVQSGNGYVFKSPLAARVNALLSLYADKTHPDLETLATRGVALVRSYEAGETALLRDPEKERAAEKLTWELAAAALRVPNPTVTPKDIALDVASEHGRELCGVFKRNPLDYLTRAVMHLGYITNQLPDNIQTSYPLRTALYCLQPYVDENHSSRDKLGPAGDALVDALPSDMSSNSLFDAFSTSQMQGALARVIFHKPEGREARWFKASLNDFATAFHSSRAAFDALLDSALRTLRRFEAEPRESTVEDHARIRTALIELIVNLIDARYALIAACHANMWVDRGAGESFVALIETHFHKNELNLREKEPGEKEEPWRRGPAHGRDDLRAMVESDPVEAAQALMNASGELKRMNEELPESECVLKDIKLPKYLSRTVPVRTGPWPLDVPKFGREFQYGLARGPTLRPALARGFLDDVHASFQVIRDTSALGLGGGRVKEGLTHLANNYLSCQKSAPDPGARTPPGCTPPEQELRRERLLQALIHFSQKVLFLANNEVLIAEAKKKSLHVTRASAKPKSKPGDNDLEANRRSYQLLLESVGNSIMSQLDDLKFRTEHEQDLDRRQATELATLRRVVSPSPQKVLDDLLVGLQADVAAAEEAENSGTAELEGLSDAAVKKAVEVASAEHGTVGQKLAAAEVDSKDSRSRAEPLMAAVNSAIGTVPDGPNDPPDLRKALVGERTDEIEAPALVTEMSQWLAAQAEVYSAAYQEQPRPARLKQAAKFLEENTKSLGTAAKGPRATVFDAVVANLRTNKTAADAEIDAKQKLVDAATAELAKAAQKLQAAKVALDAASKSRARVQTVMDAAAGSKSRLRNTSIEVSRRMPAVLSHFVGQDVVEPADVYLQIKSQLRSDKTASSCGSAAIANDAVPLCDAIATLSQRRPAIGARQIYLDPSEADKPENARDVLDRLITTLRYEHIQALQRDPSGTQASAVRTALDAALEYRASMAYLRPASVYLRNSYPSTSLQADPGLGWNNMLTDIGKRSTPLFGEWIANFGEHRKQEIQSGVDKQYWQSINRVRVSGSGRTNYILAKDDVGNWYVKAYEAKSEDIIKSAKGLAQFSFGISIPTVSKTSETPKSPASDGAKTDPLRKLFDLHVAKYDKQTESDYAALRTELAPAQIKTAITAVWKEDGTLMDKTRGLVAKDMEAAAATMEKTWEAFAENAKAEEQPDRIAVGLNALLQFRNATAQRIVARGTELTDAQRQAALQGLDEVIEPKMQKALDARRYAAKELGTAISFIGESLKQ